ncbi:MAG: hypothetical protein ACRDLR_07725, partial [Gaiellaceae bacterium]
AEQFALDLGDDAAIVAECRYYAGYCYAQTSRPNEALTRLRFYVDHASPDAGDLAAAEQYRDARYLVATMLATLGHVDEAHEQFQAVRALYAEAYGPGSAHVKRLDQQLRHLDTYISGQ